MKKAKDILFYLSVIFALFTFIIVFPYISIKEVYKTALYCFLAWALVLELKESRKVVLGIVVVLLFGAIVECFRTEVSIIGITISALLIICYLLIGLYYVVFYEKKIGRYIILMGVLAFVVSIIVSAYAITIELFSLLPHMSSIVIGIFRMYSGVIFKTMLLFTVTLQRKEYDESPQ